MVVQLLKIDLTAWANDTGDHYRWHGALLKNTLFGK